MIDIRSFTPADTDAALAANEASLPAVNSLTPDALRALAAQSRHTLVATGPDGLVGLMVCLDETADYDSRNFAWLKQNLGRFSYVDRIALAPAARGSGTGERLYRALLQRLAADPERAGLPLACEVNTRPANPGSLRFHQRLGFAEIGASDHGDKAVVYLARAVTLAEQEGASA